MASRPIFTPFDVIVAGNMSGQIISDVSVIQNTSIISYDISWTGTAPSGTMSVQVSNTYSKNAAGMVDDTGNWTTLPLSNIPTISTNTGNGAIDIDATGFYAIRLVYNFISGVGVMNATVAGKVA